MHGVMGAGHGHSDIEVPRSVSRVLLLVIVPLVALTVVGMILLWPSGDELPTLEVGEYVEGTVQTIEPCDNGDPACGLATVTVDEGPDEGDTIEVLVTVGGSSLQLEPGTSVYLVPLPEGSDPAYGLADVNRQVPLLVLTALFAIAVVALARWKGVAALFGLVVSMGILAVFVLPALLEGSSPVAVAAVGAGAIAIVSMGLAHGVNARTGVALIGTLIALLLTTVLGQLFTQAMAFTGVATEDAAYLYAVSGGVLDLQGLLLAGLVIGALGVLDDVTVTQSATVWEIYGADQRAKFSDLWSAGMRVGRDHVAAVVNTLVLAYVGASLPLFILISISDAPLLQSLNNEAIASEIVRSMVGVLGIIAAVPITTAFAAALLIRSRQRKLETDRHLHS